MSIERIESAYAHCMDRKDVTGPQMAVLAALCYCANAKTGLCCPSFGYLSRLTHYDPETTRRAAVALRDKQLIDWRSGLTEDGNVSNTYAFLFENKKLVSRRKSRVYKPIGKSPVGSVSEAPLSSLCGYPIRTVRVPYPRCAGTLSSQRGTNTEEKPKENSVDNSVAPARTEVRYLTPESMPDFRATRPTLMPKAESRALVDEAMAACDVEGMDDRRVFMSEMMKHRSDDVRECILTFASERQQGEHVNAQKPAAVLMSRLKKLPLVV